MPISCPASTRALRTLGPLLALLTVGLGHAACCHAARWSVALRSTFPLSEPTVAASQLSGLAYLGSFADGAVVKHRFAAVQDASADVVTVDMTFDAAGIIASAATVASIALPENLDYEGAAPTSLLAAVDNDATANRRVLVSDEANPGVREIDLDTGAVLASAPIPSVFDNTRTNRGFESLASWSYADDRFLVVAANEEALTIDGPASTSTATTVVRLQTFDVVGDPTATLGLTAAAQYAYEVEPIHGANGDRSGLADLVAMPDGAWIAMERSAAFTLPGFLIRLFEIDRSAATDVSEAAYDVGFLNSPVATPVGKSLLFSGGVGGILGTNLEGLTLGPQLASGNWLLAGVVDNGGSGETLLATFEATPIMTGDFSGDGLVDGKDFLSWQRVAAASDLELTHVFSADGTRDGRVDGADLALWLQEFAPPPAPAAAIPEPAALCILLLLPLVSRRR